MVKMPLGIKIVKAACVLHNFLRRNRIEYESTNREISEAIEDARGIRNFVPDESQANSNAQEIRNKFSDYFISAAGSVSWQNNRIENQ